MFETESEVQELEALLARSHAGAGQHMLSIVKPERTLNARQVLTYLQGVKHVAFATVTSRGEPFVSPLDGLFLHGRFWVSTSGRAVKVRHVERQPAVSLAHLVGDEIGIWIHGRVDRILRQGDSGVREWERIATETYGSSPFGWEPDIVVMPLEPRKMFAYASNPGNFPETLETR